jgi:hypothetical protein
MADATAMHVRQRTVGARVLVAAIALLFVTSGVLGRRHEAQVAHVTDPTTGAVVHAQHLAGHHDQTKHSDVHGQVGAGDHDACALSATIHQAAISSPVLHVALGAGAARTLDPRRAQVTPALDIYRFAPKTSPPVA